MEGAGIT